MLFLLFALTQDAAPYVPLSHWGMPYVEHWIARGAVADPAPLTRPLARPALLGALAGADTARLTAGERRLLERLRDELSDRERGPAARLSVHAGAAAATHARRDPLRAAGPERGTVSGGAALELRVGHVAAVTHPYFDTRLRFDPDYRGKKDRAIAGRNAGAYLNASWRFGEVFFGALDRNWGPPVVEGLLLSPAPYSYEHLFLEVGTPGVRLQGLLAQLDDLPDTAGVPHHRYYVAHRLVVRPGRRFVLALWEGTLLAGPERTLEPWYANLVNLGLLAQYDQGANANNQLGFDAALRLGRVVTFASALIDDIQVDRGNVGDDEPTSYGLTVGAQGPAGPAAWTLFYTRVANLTYRTPQVTETVMRRGVGLARDFSDYDQLTARLTAVVGPGILAGPELTLLRQGEGDFRLPYPPTADYGTTPTFLAGVVERTVRAAVVARFDRRRVGARTDVALHFVTNAGHVTGVTDTRFVGSVAFEYRFTWSHPLP